jgi:hypothetical protein
VRVFKYPRFSHFADKEGITDNELLEIVVQLEGDQADVNLGETYSKYCTAYAELAVF